MTMLGVGACTIAADQVGSPNYNAAVQVTQNLAIGLASQTISAFIAAPASPTFASGGTFTVLTWLSIVEFAKLRFAPETG